MIKSYKKGKATQISDHFKSTEFDCKGDGCCSTTKVDTELIDDLERIRKHFRRPVYINSGYRCTKHNKDVGGSGGSKHLNGMAADIRVKDVKPETVAKYAEFIGMKGIGLYSNYVHVDTRTKKFFWKTSKQTPVTTFGGTCPYSEPKVSVRKGDRGNNVRWCQWMLNFCGYNCGKVDGIAGPKFVSATKKFQKSRGLTVDGIIGKKTRAALKNW